MPLPWRGVVLVPEIAEMVARVIGTAVAGLAQMGALVIATIGVVVLATAQNAKTVAHVWGIRHSVPSVMPWSTRSKR